MKTKEEISKDEEEFYRIQELVLNAKTQEERTKYAWEMYPIIKSAMESAIKVRANHHYITDFENVLEELTETLVERFIKRPKRYQHFKTLIYYKSLDLWLPKYHDMESLDQLLEDNELNEDRLCYVRDEDGTYHLC